MPDQQPNQTLKKVIVAVHGIGDQTEYATIQTVVARFGDYNGVTAAAVPLGYFHNAKKPLLTPSGFPERMQGLAFTEAYWANIPRKIVKKGYRLESAQGWARTIVARLWLRSQTLLKEGKTPTEGQVMIKEEECPMVEQVLKESLQTLQVLDRLCWLGEELGLFKFDLNRVMLDYLDDVQLVADFKTESGDIVKRFSDLMQQVHDDFPTAEIYIVAHSEGTVVSLLGLLGAMCPAPGSAECAQKPAWLDHVRGWMTIGSPIDKHLVLWPELFEDFGPPPNAGDAEKAQWRPQWQPAQPIEWRNYYDFGDPVGFELDQARAHFTTAPWRAFNFTADDDFGFSRYMMPGAAHNMYWTDDDVFGHFLQTVVYKEEHLPPAGKDAEKRKVIYSQPPKNKPLKATLSYVLPYVGALVLMFVAVFVLQKSLLYVGAVSYKDVKDMSEGKAALFDSAAVTLLLAGMTVLARIVRLTRPWFWWVFGLVFFIVCIAAYGWLSPNESLFTCHTCTSSDFFSQLGGAIKQLFSYPLKLIGLVTWVSLAAVLFSVLAGVLHKHNWGMRTLLIPGALGLVIYLVGKVEFGSLLFSQVSSLLLSAAFFYYLWWLVALLFDLVFIWHRYIRHSDKWKL